MDFEGKMATAGIELFALLIAIVLYSFGYIGLWLVPLSLFVPPLVVGFYLLYVILTSDENLFQ